MAFFSSSFFVYKFMYFYVLFYFSISPAKTIKIAGEAAKNVTEFQCNKVYKKKFIFHTQTVFFVCVFFLLLFLLSLLFHISCSAVIVNCRFPVTQWEMYTLKLLFHYYLIDFIKENLLLLVLFGEKKIVDCFRLNSAVAIVWFYCAHRQNGW